MHLLQDIVTYVRRIIKTPSNQVITDGLIIDYINRFWISDVDARIQLFDLKTKYQFQTRPGYDQYNMPMYGLQTQADGQIISYYPVYQGFLGPAYINGVPVRLETQKDYFFNHWINVVQQLNIVLTGNGGTSYQFQLPIGLGNQTPINTPMQYLLRGNVDVQGCMAVANQALSSYIDPLVVTGAEALVSIPAAPVANVFPAVYITSNMEDGTSIVVSDSGQFLRGQQNYGLLMSPGPNPDGNTTLSGGYSATISGASQTSPCVLTAANSMVGGQFVTINGVLGMTELNGQTYEILSATPTTITIDVDATGFSTYISSGAASMNYINYLSGQVIVTFPQAIPQGTNINVQCYWFNTGLPREILFNNNTLTFRSPPDKQYLVEVDAYLSPAGFLATNQAIQFGYMCEYIARGAARKILSDTGDTDQFAFYEPLFQEQEMLVWKRSQRQFTATRTQTIYSQGPYNGNGNGNANGNYGGTL